MNGIVIGSSRTDRGVHALQSVIHFDLERVHRRTKEILPSFPDEQLFFLLNKKLENQDICILNLQQVPSTYDVRHAITQRHYCYRVMLSKPFVHPLVLRNRVWSIDTNQRLFLWNQSYPNFDVENDFQKENVEIAMNKLVGTHNFSAFAGAIEPGVSPMREMHSVSLEIIHHHKPQNHLLLQTIPFEYGPHFYSFLKHRPSQTCTEIQFHFKAKSFLYHQIRIMTSTLLKVVFGELQPFHIDEAFASRNSSITKAIAPPDGLYLMNVKDPYS